MTQQKQYDIIIIGGGIVGLTLACILPSRLQIAVLEEKTPAPMQQPTSSSFDTRVSAINRASQQIFQAIRAWSVMQTERVSPYRAMQVWDNAGRGEIHFDSLMLGEANLGHIIENSVMQNALLQQIQQRHNVDVVCPALPISLSLTENKIIITLQNQISLSAKLLVGADGAHSWVREQAKIDLTMRSYQQHALVTTVHTELPHNQTARQCFLTDGGILALLPLTDPHHCSIVWSTSPEIAIRLQQQSTTEFNSAINKAFGACLGSIEKVSNIMLFPLSMRHAKQYVKSRIALVGDAAHTIHPLAGQGINLGLLDAACLAEVIQRAHEKNRDIGTIDTLRRYERWRKGDNLLMIAAMEGFKRLFASQRSPIIHARALGLNAVDKTTGLKNFFIRHAMGLQGDLPAIAK